MDEPIRCEICREDLGPYSLDARQLHYEQHFEPLAESSVASSSKPSTPSPSSPKKKFTPNKFQSKLKHPLKENDVFWYASKAGPPSKNFTPGLIPLLRKSLLASHGRGELRKAALCYSEAVYIQHELWDTGWGCGYRNFLMACACLMAHPLQPMYFPLLDTPTPPSIRNLQAWIEDAWNRGFDPEGREQLKKLVGSRKWIGTSDLYTAFSSRGIPAELVDFTDAKDPQVVIKWIVDYFTPPNLGQPTYRNAFEQLKGAIPVISTDKLPVILQHNGHSRSIVGYEILKDGTINLLTFDSGASLPKEFRALGLSFAAPASPAAGSKRLAPTTPNSSRHSASIAAATTNTDDDEIVITGYSSPVAKASSSSQVAPKPFDYKGVLRHFRLSPKSLGRKKQYQIMYFPMSDPLSEVEMENRKIVQSTKIC
ncbi:peptidase family C78-domain-containing protein [Coprinopsis sp. MPI-PUGE-AT-0042]|nr:peptidase family C78-domain-containing protein [Coprinopsis sp. MPI-PUGE-AT-0042]